VYVADSFESDISISGNTQSSPCQSLKSNSIIHFSLAVGCGDSSLSNRMKYGLAYQITSIIPNPARNTVHVELKNNGAGLHYELFDALGITRKNDIVAGNSFQLDVSDLSAGGYYLRISGEKGIPITKKLVIAK
jgi:predicted GTPase